VYNSQVRWRPRDNRAIFVYILLSTPAVGAVTFLIFCPYSSIINSHFIII